MKAQERLVFFFLASFALACTPSGANWQPYRISALAEAQSRGMVVYLHVDDPQDPICKAQKKLLTKLTRGERFKKTAAFRVAYGTEGLLEREYRIQEACQLLVFKGERLYSRIGRQKSKSHLKTAITQPLDL